MDMAILSIEVLNPIPYFIKDELGVLSFFKYLVRKQWRDGWCRELVAGSREWRRIEVGIQD